MRKLSALLLVAGVFTFAACQKKADTAATDSTATTVVETKVDTTPVVPMDSTMADTTMKK